jgi:hypothetical protein
MANDVAVIFKVTWFNHYFVSTYKYLGGTYCLYLQGMSGSSQEISRLYRKKGRAGLWRTKLDSYMTQLFPSSVYFYSEDGSGMFL